MRHRALNVAAATIEKRSEVLKVFRREHLGRRVLAPAPDETAALVFILLFANFALGKVEYLEQQLRVAGLAIEREGLREIDSQFTECGRPRMPNEREEIAALTIGHDGWVVVAQETVRQVGAWEGSLRVLAFQLAQLLSGEFLLDFSADASYAWTTAIRGELAGIYEASAWVAAEGKDDKDVREALRGEPYLAELPGAVALALAQRAQEWPGYPFRQVRLLAHSIIGSPLDGPRGGKIRGPALQLDHLGRDDEDDDQAEEPGAVDPGYSRIEAGIEAREAVSLLRGRQRQIAELRLKGYDTSEIAEELKITPDAIYEAERRGRKRLLKRSARNL